MYAGPNVVQSRQEGLLQVGKTLMSGRRVGDDEVRLGDCLDGSQYYGTPEFENGR